MMLVSRRQSEPGEVSHLAQRSTLDTLDLADWRRRVAELYAAIRTSDDPYLGWTLWRAARDRLFEAHPQSPIPLSERASFREIPLYPYDPSLRFEVRVTAPAKVLGGGSLGHHIPLQPALQTFGLARRLGRELTIYWIDTYGGGLFLPFRDGTCGTETYGGGRYLLDGIKGADLGSDSEGRLILDFNFAYHPSCVYDAKWQCPLAPRANWLDTSICAGERMQAHGIVT